jgi:hypothetical protein
MDPNTNYLVVKVENHLFLKLFPIRVIIDDKTVYTVKGKKGIYTPIPTNQVNVQLNNGYHYAKPLQLNFARHHIIGLRVETYLSDGRLLGILVLTAALFLASFVEDAPILRWIANLPILIIIGYAAFMRNKIILLSNLADKSHADKFYENYENIL